MHRVPDVTAAYRLAGIQVVCQVAVSLPRVAAAGEAAYRLVYQREQVFL
jgi:hypothetical protein